MLAGALGVRRDRKCRCEVEIALEPVSRGVRGRLRARGSSRSRVRLAATEVAKAEREINDGLSSAFMIGTTVLVH
jgi:hypothetical protein